MELNRVDEDKILGVLELYHGDYVRASRKLGISERVIQTVDIKRNKKFGYTPQGRGPAHMQRYILQIRSVFDGSGWDNSDPKIKEARVLYDQGRIEMATGRDGFNLILYAIPRRDRLQRKPYFSNPKFELIG